MKVGPFLAKTYLAVAPFLVMGSSSYGEDCVSLNYRNAEVKEVGGRWKIVEGNHWAFDFGSTSSSQVEASKALDVIKKNRIMESCFVGRPNSVFSYVLSTGHQAPFSADVRGEDCIAFNPATVEAKEINGQWKMVSGNMWMVHYGSDKDSANESVGIVKKYQFNRQCYVGRPDPSFQYWKRVEGGRQMPKPDLTTNGVVKIGKNQGQPQVMGPNVFVVKKEHVFLMQNGFAAVNLFYTEKNIGKTSASAYTNRIRFNDQEVSVQKNRPEIQPNQSREVHTQAYLKVAPGIHTLEISLDDENQVEEEREENNRVAVRVSFDRGLLETIPR